MASKRERLREVVALSMADRYHALMSPPKARKLHVVLVGAGAIGSWAALALVKLGVQRFTVYDMDVVDPPNVGVQAYGAMHLGMRKVDALASLLDAVTAGGVKVSPKHGKFTEKTRLPKSADVIVASLDNIPTREAVWAATLGCGGKVRPLVYIDPRMGAEQLDIKTTVLNVDGKGFTPSQRAEYEKSFHKNVPPAPCGANSTPYAAMACGAAVAAKVKQAVNGEDIATWSVMAVPQMNVIKGADNAGHLATHNDSARGKR